MTTEDAWQRLVSWCQQNAPVTFGYLQPPAQPAALAAAEARFPRAWPDDLREWYRLQNGAAWESSNTPLPDWRILSLEQMIDSAEMYAGFWDGDELAEADQDDAGAMAWAFAPSFVPIADNIAACTLFVDTRPGPLHGCVHDWDRDEGALSEQPKWDSVTSMLEDVASALEEGRDCDGWRPTVVDGVLAWELSD